ncbi:MAG: hypothetical protein MUC89_19420 [Acetobacteraceae bacterium]|jgi:hypothetical protein|nr:hypothetical protein [Acetobacteraceae bacterium]
MSVGKRPTQPGAAFRPPPEVIAADRRRYDLALGVDLAVALGLGFIFALSFVTGSPPSGRLLLAWLALLGGVGLVVAGGVLLRFRDRVGAATLLLSLVAAPACIIGFALAPFALAAAIAAVSNTAEFRVWAGPDFSAHLPWRLLTLGVLAALVPASLLTRPWGRHVLGLGLSLGAVVMIAVVLFGIVGGFTFRHMR